MTRPRVRAPAAGPALQSAAVCDVCYVRPVDFPRVLDRLIAHLDGHRHRWALVGGLAMQSYGLSRATQDVDVVVEASGRAAAISFMESLGYETLHASGGFSNHLHTEPALGRVDFLYVDTQTANTLFAACRRITGIHGRTVAVPAPQHLIAMKVHAAKNDPSRTLREMADIEHLLRQPGVELTSVRDYFEAAGLLRWVDELARKA
jgi:hypothetical protein